MQNKTIILVGCGNMGRAMLEGWLSAGIVAPTNAHIVEPADALRQMAKDLGVECHASADTLPASLKPDLIVLAVKPQMMLKVTDPYVKFADAGSAIVSVAAGIRTAKLEGAFGADAAIMRVMPNTPAAISKGMMVIFNNANVTADQKNFAEQLMGASGAVTTIDDETLMDAVTAVSGSGPAYVFHMIEALRDAGIAAGLPEDTAKLLAEQTIYGAACYAKESSSEPGLLREQVTSPNGTTAAALNVLMQDDALSKLMRDAVAAAKKRSEELAL